MLIKLIKFFHKMNLTILKPFGKQLDKSQLKISICDKNKEIAEIFANIFQNIQGVEITCGNIFNVGADSIISPANSFGDMGGGFDKVIDDFFEGEAQHQVQSYISDNFMGEMPVGTAAIISMQSLLFPYLIVAPTMRIPSNVGKTLNAYLAMRAILIKVLQHNQHNENKINHITLTPLCTGIGGMAYQESAKQMLTAYENVIFKGWQFVTHPSLAPFASSIQWNWNRI